MLHFNIVTLFPQFFDSPLKQGLLAKAVQKQIVSFSFYNPRDYATNRHKQADDAPYGGGSGMVMQVEPVLQALRAIPDAGKAFLLSPAGASFTQMMAQNLSALSEITLVCGRYEGIDARLSQLFPLYEISVGDVVLNGGETAALAVIEAICRFAPGFLGRQESALTESFADNLLECPHFTRPEIYEKARVPKILLEGHHAKIEKWRREQGLAKTLKNRPDLLRNASLQKSDADYIASLPHRRVGRNISFCLFHYPVLLDKRQIGVSSLTNLDVHDIARISSSYGMGDFYILTPLADQLDLLRKILRHWLDGDCRPANQDRRAALSLVRPVADFAELDELCQRAHGQRPLYIATSANWPEKKSALPLIGPEELRNMAADTPVVICLGTAKGLYIKGMPFCSAQLRPLRFLNANHLSVRSAAAVTADRILGDFF